MGRFDKQHREYNWTPSAIECYQRGGICEKCPIFLIMETPCKMKETIIEIVRVRGKPPSKEKVLKERLKGMSILEIAHKLGLSTAAVHKIAESIDFDRWNDENKM